MVCQYNPLQAILRDWSGQIIKYGEGQRQWTTTRKQCFLHTETDSHTWIQAIVRTCRRPDQWQARLKSQDERGKETWSHHLCWSDCVIWGLLGEEESGSRMWPLVIWPHSKLSLITAALGQYKLKTMCVNTKSKNTKMSREGGEECGRRLIVAMRLERN